MISLAEFEKQVRVKKNAPPPYVILTGEEEYLRSEALGFLLARYGDEGDVVEIAREKVEASDDPAALLYDELLTSSLFGSGKVVRLTNAEVFIQKASDSLMKFAKANAVDTVLVLEGANLVKKSGRKVTKSKLMQALEKAGGAIVDCSPLSDRVYGFGKPEWECELAKWVQRRVERKDKKVSLAVADAIHRRETTGLRGVASEIEKILVHLGDREEILIDDVDAVVGPGDEATLFEVVDAFGERDFKRVLVGCDRLFRSGIREKNGTKNLQPTDVAMRLVPLLARRLRELGRITELVHSGERFEDAAAAVLGSGRRWLFGKMEVQFRARKGPELADAVLGLEDTENAIKSSGGNARDLIVDYLGRHARKAPVVASDNPFAGRPRP